MDTSKIQFKGKLVVSGGDWGCLHVPQALVDGLYAGLHEPGIEKPEHRAHISVFTTEELNKIGADKLKERGTDYHFTLGRVVKLNPKNWAEMSKVWFITCSSPELEKLRTSYGLTPKVNGDHPFHITFATRRVGTASGTNKRVAPKETPKDSKIKDSDSYHKTELIKKAFDYSQLLMPALGAGAGGMIGAAGNIVTRDKNDTRSWWQRPEVLAGMGIGGGIGALANRQIPKADDSSKTNTTAPKVNPAVAAKTYDLRNNIGSYMDFTDKGLAPRGHNAASAGSLAATSAGIGAALNPVTRLLRMVPAFAKHVPLISATGAAAGAIPFTVAETVGGPSWEAAGNIIKYPLVNKAMANAKANPATSATKQLGRDTGMYLLKRTGGLSNITGDITSASALMNAYRGSRVLGNIGAAGAGASGLAPALAATYGVRTAAGLAPYAALRYADPAMFEADAKQYLNTTGNKSLPAQVWAGVAEPKMLAATAGMAPQAQSQYALDQTVADMSLEKQMDNHARMLHDEFKAGKIDGKQYVNAIRRLADKLFTPTPADPYMTDAHNRIVGKRQAEQLPTDAAQWIKRHLR